MPHVLYPSARLAVAGVTSALAHWQKQVKRCRSIRSPAAVEDTADLRVWAAEHRLPDRLEDMEADATYAVPMDYERFPSVDAVVLCGKTQCLWMLQLVHHARQWVLHVDGKHKLHHGKWLLITLGTHAVEQRTLAHCQSHTAKVVHAFRPLVYMFSKTHEDKDSLLFAFTAMEVVVRMCAPPLPLPPSARPSEYASQGMRIGVCDSSEDSPQRMRPPVCSAVCCAPPAARRLVSASECAPRSMLPTLNTPPRCMRPSDV